MIENDKLREIYNPEGSELRNLQLTLLDMLMTIDSICKKNNIKYTLAYGSVLGAIRHQGFIPWDDDLDIQMDYKEYKKFVSIVEKELPDNLVLQTHKTDKHYWSVYGKIRKLGTEVSEKTAGKLYKKYKYKGFYIDIFPLEKSTFKVTKLSDRLYSNMVVKIAKRYSDNIFAYYVCSVNRFILLYMIFPFLRFFTNKSLYCTTALGSYQEAEIMKWEDIQDCRYVLFEGKMVPVPKNTDSYLKSLYGDYMKLPDELHRMTHLI